MIYQQVNFSQFCDSFSDTYKDNFSYEGKRALWEYLDTLSEDTEDNIELDTIALCCEYTQYDDFQELQGVYPDIESMEELEERTTVIYISDSEAFIVADF